MKRSYFFITLIVLVEVSAAHFAQAASFIIHPIASDAVRIGLVLDTQGASINAIEAHLTFDPSLFAITEVDDGGSVVSAWIDEPAFSNDKGTVDLAGIIPGGINTANGTIVTIAIAPRAPGNRASFTVASASALLNDGEGTPAKLTITSPGFTLAPPSPPATDTMSSADTEAPDIFTPKIGQDPALFDGKYFLVFGTTDARSGIDHYEVQEGMGSWQVATSPYALHDQTLSSDILVRAVDRAGNFRVARVLSEHPADGTSREVGNTKAVFFGIIIVFAITIILLLWIILRRRKKE